MALPSPAPKPVRIRLGYTPIKVLYNGLERRIIMATKTHEQTTLLMEENHNNSDNAIH